MNPHQEQLDSLRDIRNFMERSSRYLPLSGIAGIIIGLVSIASIGWLYQYLGLAASPKAYYELLLAENGSLDTENALFLLMLFGSVFLVSLGVEIYLAERNAKKKGIPAWDATAKRFLVNLFIPMIAGGLFCMVLASQGQVQLILPATLIFYGMGLFTASRYTIEDIRYLGLAEIGLGLLASFYPALGLFFWAIGFGLLHIVYGIIIYFKHEK
jgi:hypothetical protein